MKAASSALALAVALAGCQSAPEPASQPPPPKTAQVAPPLGGGAPAASTPREPLPPELEVRRQRREVAARNHAEQGKAALAARRYDAGISSLEECLATIRQSELPLGLESLEAEVTGLVARARLDKLEHDRASAIEQSIEAQRRIAEEQESGMGRR